MADFGGLTITEQGQNLLALAQAGTGINFTHVECGSGIWDDEQNPEALTDLEHSELTLAIQSIDVPGDGSTTVTVLLTNAALEAGIFFREIGLFASAPNSPGDEILYAVAYAGGLYDFIPAQGGTPVEQQIDLITVVGNAAQVSATISGTVIIATKQNIEDHDQDQAAHPGLRVQTPVIAWAGSASVEEGDTVTALLQGFVPGRWDLEAAIIVTDVDGNEIDDPFGFVWNAALGTITGTAPDVGTTGEAFGLAIELWEHGLIRTNDRSNVLDIFVGDCPVNQPSVTNPAAGATAVGETPTITTSEYDADIVNLFDDSDDFTGDAWNIARGSISVDAWTAPDGTLMDIFSETGETGEHRCSQSENVTNDTQYCFSVKIHPLGRSTIALYTHNLDSAARLTWFDLTAGAVSSLAHADAGIEDCGGGVYRCWIVIDSGGDAPGVLYANILSETSVGLNSAACALAEAQFELGSKPSAYQSSDIKEHAATQIQIATASDFATLAHDSGTLGAVTSYDVPSGDLSTSFHYYVRARHQSAAGGWSSWSASVDFYTSSSFVWVEKPVISAPLAGATGVEETPEIAGSAYNTSGTGEHASTDWQIQAVGGDWSAPVYESLADTGNLESITVPAGILSVSTSYQARCRYRDDSGTPVESDWSEAVSFTTAASFLASTLWAAWDQLSESTLADSNVIVCMLENPVTGGNEQAQGGGLAAAELLMEQYGNVDGATADGRHFTGGYFRGCTGLADWLSGASVVAFAGVVRINDGELENSIVTYSNPDLVWMINGTSIATRTLQFAGMGHSYNIVSGYVPQDTWIHCYLDIRLSGGQAVLRMGWDTVKRNRWQDVTHRLTSSAAWAASLTTGASELFIAASPNAVSSYNLRGDIKYGVIARDVLLED